ncbi:MAG: MotA/TolQ/ExbB proton channel family protein [Deltaproteobacteria bacterium]|nr:MotA/TolQ/ExbB proton channel family protein [Deltaproteobacteria bacterium]
MTDTILAGISLIDATGLTILGMTLSTLVLGLCANLWLRGRYAVLERDLGGADGVEQDFRHRVLRNILREADEAARRPGEPNFQAIIEERFHKDLRPMLLAERFVRGATGLAIILGLLGTFYGLTLSIGRIVELVAGEAGATADITQGVSQGLSHALSGMAVAFSNSLVGVLSAVILTVVGMLWNVSDRRNAVMVQIETYLDRMLPKAGAGTGVAHSPAGLEGAMARLDAAVARFESALHRFASTTGEFHDFNAHLKDNVQRLSLAFGDMSTTLKEQLGPLRHGGRG